MEVQKNTIRGVLEKIIFKNSETGFMVGKVRTEESNVVTIVGNAFELQCGESLEITGKWVLNKNYGRQFGIENIKTMEPATIDGIKNYLGSGLIKGIGPVMAERIVCHFKLDTLKVLDKKPERLKEIDGIGRKRIGLIKQSWEKHRKIRDVLIYLQSIGIGSSYSMKIYNNYGDNSISVIKSNPYRLSEDIFGIGFKTSDKIALKTGIKKDSIFRIKAGIIYILKEAEDAGHCYYPYQELRDMAEGFLETEMAKINNALVELEKENKVIIVRDGEDKVYLAGIYNAENYVSKKIVEILNSPDKENAGNGKKERMSSLIKLLSEEENIALDYIQEKAIKKAVTEKILVITGKYYTEYYY